MQVFLMLLVLFCPWALAASNESERPDFATWLSGIRQEAINRGYSESTVAALDDLKPNERVIGFDRKQPEFVQTFEQYLDARVSSDRIRMAKEFLQSEAELLGKISAHYGVEPEVIVAFWGLESSFGRYQGKYPVIRSVATLAYDPRRSRFFTRQLFDALTILEEGHVTVDNFLGGWAGAMGQNQFIPSSFLNYAQDFDGDGKKNIWSSRADVFASIAYYLKKNRWQQGAGWGESVLIPPELDLAALKPASTPKGCRAYRHHTLKQSPDAWRAAGVNTSLQGGEYALLIPGDGEQKSYLVGGNFRSILAYNCANKYAVSVGLLADKAVQSFERE